VAETEKKNNEDVLEEKKTKKDSKKSKEAELQAQLDEKNDLYLRLAAEYDNFRKRSQKEKESAYSDSKAKLERIALLEKFRLFMVAPAPPIPLTPPRKVKDLDFTT